MKIYNNKRMRRIRRAMKLRCKLRKFNSVRLVVYRTLRHIYAQIVSFDGYVLAAASTVEKSILKQINRTNNKDAAYFIGTKIAERSLKKGIKHVSFDRSGFLFHGRIKELANAARHSGLIF